MPDKYKKINLLNSTGFTLLELILVMVIISTLLAIASPSLQGFFTSRRTNDAASNILSLMKLARTQAITEGRIYRLNLDTDKRSYWLTAVEEGIFNELKTEFGRTFILPVDTSVELEKETKDDLTEKYIEFYPEGWAQSGLIRLTDRRGDVIEIMSSSPLERYRVNILEENSVNG
ncbi:GspH/FimT family pseudopilin [Thermodesulfobacteriota bacterium]